MNAEMEKKNTDGGSGGGFIEAEKVERRQESARYCRRSRWLARRSWNWPARRRWLTGAHAARCRALIRPTL
jgi:hypothetical protein